MKNMKKIVALALVMIMTLGLAITASAANTPQNGPFDVTINNATGHQYVIYQIFTADLSLDENGKEILSNIKYGADYTPDGKQVGDEAVIPENFDPDDIQPTGTGTAMVTDGDTVTATGLTAGYYMIVDVTPNLPEGESLSAVIFQVVGDTNINSKHSKTTIVKKVQDINDTTGEYTVDEDDSNWIDSADYDINDVVPFKSTANFTGLNNYETYKVIFTDTMAEGLTYNADMKVLVNGEDKTSAFTIATAACTDTEGDYVNGTVITVSCNDITALTNANSAEIVLEYTATLNEKAKLGSAGNPNKIKVTTTPDGEGETPEDVNIVFTFKVNVDKYTTIDEEKVALSGAKFALYKLVASADAEGAKTGAAIKAELLATNANIKADALKDDLYYVVAAEVDVDADGDTFGFKGIDDGTYVLVETVIPAGYNAWDAEEFDVVATHDVVADMPELTTLEGGDLLTGDVSTGILSTEIENNSGIGLPETGGIGTTIFYIVGGLLAGAAVVLLITKKRMNSAE